MLLSYIRQITEKKFTITAILLAEGNLSNLMLNYVNIYMKFHLLYGCQINIKKCIKMLFSNYQKQ